MERSWHQHAVLHVRHSKKTKHRETESEIPDVWSPYFCAISTMAVGNYYSAMAVAEFHVALPALSEMWHESKACLYLSYADES